MINKKTINLTNKYYDNNAKEYARDTFSVDMGKLYAFFEKELLAKHRTILDLGFGSGRDSLYFVNKGYDVYSVDCCESFCELGKNLGLKNIYCMSLLDMELENMFDGIWASASLLHIPSNKLKEVFVKCFRALKGEGVMYASFKYGDFEGMRDDRYYVDLTLEKLASLLVGTGLRVKDSLISFDNRNNNNTRWLNVILTKNKD